MKLDRVIIKVADYRKSFAFYHDTLSLKLKSSWQRTDSWGALFYCGEALLEIIWFPVGEQNSDCNYIPERSKTELFLVINNIDTLFNRLQALGNLDLTPPESKSWGYRVFTIYDPDRIKIVFSQPI